MKKVLTLLLALTFALSLAGCGGDQEETQTPSSPSFMLSTTYAYAKDCYEAICDYEAGRIDFNEADSILTETCNYLDIEYDVINRDTTGKYTPDDKYFNAIVLDNVANYREYLRTGTDDYMGPDYYREVLNLVINCESPEDFSVKIRNLSPEQ